MSDRPSAGGRGRARGTGRGGDQDKSAGTFQPRGGGRGRPPHQQQQGRVGPSQQGQRGGGGQYHGGASQGQRGGPSQYQGQQRGGPYQGGQQQGYRGPPQQGQRGQFQDAPAPQTGAWGPRPAQQPAQKAQEFPPIGRATGGDSGDAGSVSQVQRYAGSASDSGNGNGNGNGAGARTRGNIRGNRTLHESTIITRPAKLVSKKGLTGVPITLTANYFQLIKTTQLSLCLYSVEFAPAQDSTSVKKRLVNTILRAKDSPFSGYIFDGTSLYSTTEMKEYTNTAHDDRATGDNDSGNVKIRITSVKMLQPGDFQYIQLFNIIMRRCLQYLKLVLVGRNFFDANAVVRLHQHELDLWPGYLTSIRQHEDSILMCAEITHKVMRHDTAYHLFLKYFSNSDQRYQKAFADEILNTVVLTAYNNRTYTITDVDYSVNPKSTFPRKDGTEISYVEYYKNKYNIIIKNLNQPLLVSRSGLREVRAGMSENIYLIPECCRLTGLTESQRNNFNLMRALADNTRVGPPARIEKLLRFSKRLTDNPDVMEQLRTWNMKLANNLVEIQGRVLPPETIHSVSGLKYSAGDQADWTRELRDKSMLSTASIQNWAVIYPSRDKQGMEQFLQMLKRAGGAMHFRLPQPQYSEVQDDRLNSYLQALERLSNQANPPTLIFVVVPNNKSDRYSAIKKKCYIDRAILSQVILGKNLSSKGAMSIATKVAIQMNAKLGGVPWTLHLPLTGLMVVGFDVCHDAQHRDRRYGAFVASIDSTFGQYYSVVTNHPKNEELSSEFSRYMKGAMEKYRQRNNAYPERIMIYRDGVGDGQLNQVITQEVANLFKECEELTHKPKVTYIIVTKRINTRIFANSNNPKPGTVVDSVVTLPERYDFFIVSQCVRQGTVSPTSYNVIRDDSGLSPDQVQRLTYKMTHMYFNWSGTVRVPAPCQYAHKLAFLAGQHLHQGAHKSLETSLYYL